MPSSTTGWRRCYRLIFDNWDSSIARQAVQLRAIIDHEWGQGVATILDVSCGIGTQAVGLAKLGYRVTAADLSVQAVVRARREAATRGVEIPFSVCDMREVHRHHGDGFDLLLSCDNSIPHLLSDDDILAAFRQMYSCLRPGGACLVSVRDYDREERGKTAVKTYGVREAGDKRYLIFQLWDWDDDRYDLTMYFVEEDRATGAVQTHVMGSRYYAISPKQLLALMEEAGFTAVKRLDDRFYQPVLLGSRPRSS